MLRLRSGVSCALAIIAFYSLCFISLASAQVIPGRYIVILQDPPVSSRFETRAALDGAQAQSYRQQIEARQASIKQDLAARHMTVTGSVSVLLNALFVNTTPNRVAELQSVSGVAAVRPMRKFKPLLDKATTLLNGPAAWSALGGASNAGAGVKIAIIDSGIDQTHPAFQDSSLSMPAGFPKFTTGHPEDQAYTTNKVIVARSYVRLLSAPTDPNNPAADSLPDDYSPRDRNGHGTSVASCAAAVLTTTPGIASDGTAIKIQGMAPKAYLGNYKIAGSPGVVDFATDQTLIQAVEDAVNDGMDVITTSWGSNALTNVANDPTAMAWEAAAKTGAVVLAAAGNGGEDGAQGANYPNFNSISSPSNAPDVISVGATENAHVMLPAVTVNGSGVPSTLIGIPAQGSDAFFYPSFQGSNTGKLVDVTSLGDNGLACSSLPAGKLTGLFVLVQRGTCTFATKATNAQNAGAIGMIVYWADSSAVFPLEGVGGNNSTDANFVGPIVAISNAAGLALKSYVDANVSNSVTIAAGATEMDVSAYSQEINISPTVTSNMLVGFSSMGPTPDGMLKPDVVAVGGNDIGYLLPDPNNFFLPSPSGLYMATQSYDPNADSSGEVNYSSNGYWAADGTSFATPMTAGAAALVKQAHAGQTLRGTQIKSLLMGSTSLSVMSETGGLPVDAEWIGAGLVNAGAAVSATITAEPSSISFGILNGATFPIAQNINLTNIGSAGATLAVSVSCCTVNAQTGSLTNATLALSSSSISLAAGASSTLTVTLSGAAPPAGEYSGAVVLTQGSTTTRIPFMMIVGSGTPSNVNVINLGGEGTPGEDIGPSILQVTDQFGAPVTNSPVTFSVSPRNAVTFQSVTGEPACTVSASSATCNTDQYGFAYAEVINGPNARSATISSTVAGFPVSGSVTIQPAPNVTGAADAAAGLTTVAPGSYVAIYGTALSNTTNANGVAYNPNSNPTTEATDPVTANGAVLPLQIDLVTVSFDVPGTGISVPGHLTYVSPTQVNVQVPWELQGQTSAKMKVTLDGDLIGNVVNLSLANAAPAFFGFNGIAIGQDLGGHLLTAQNPAVRGNTIILYANGLGPVSNTPASGDPAAASPLSKSTTTPVVMIGGQQAQVSFSGLVPGLPGLYQMNVVIPTATPTGSQNITVAVGGATSPTLMMPIQ
ncbi:MAG TPA: S8 family serine peptidase [Bryobacteraceae bacterium]|nr:S8 family serine peptidase [Bryobacteraceae bacterium]